jgi:hypothetical protein
MRQRSHGCAGTGPRTILATSGGIGERRRTRFSFTALTDFAVDLSGVTGGQKRYDVSKQKQVTSKPRCADNLGMSLAGAR